MGILPKSGQASLRNLTSFHLPNSSRKGRNGVSLLIFLLVLTLFSGCVTGRWVQEGKTDEDIQRDQADCEVTIREDEGIELLPEQYTSTRYWEREPPLQPSQESQMARAMRQCMESKGYKFFRK